jgi:hypothetical protein
MGGPGAAQWLWATVVLAARLAWGEGDRAGPKRNSVVFLFIQKYSNSLN